MGIDLHRMDNTTLIGNKCKVQRVYLLRYQHAVHSHHQCLNIMCHQQSQCRCHQCTYLPITHSCIHWWPRHRLSRYMFHRPCSFMVQCNINNNNLILQAVQFRLVMQIFSDDSSEDSLDATPESKPLVLNADCDEFVPSFVQKSKTQTGLCAIVEEEII